MFEEHKEPLFRFLYRLTRNAPDAEDLLQETFLVAWRKRDRFEGGDEPRVMAAYLRRTAYRLFLNARERSRRRADLAPTTIATEACDVPREPDDESERREVIGFLAGRVREALDGLPDVVREAFVMFRYEGLTCAQIADATGAPVKTVETRVGRATRLLARKLRPLEHHMSHL